MQSLATQSCTLVRRVARGGEQGAAQSGPGRPGVALARGHDGKGGAGSGLRARSGCGSRRPDPAPGTRVRGHAPRSPAAQALHRAAGLGGVQRAARGRLQLQPVLQALPRVAGASRRDNGPAPQGRREALRRLRREHGDRARCRGALRGADLRGDPGCQLVLLRRGHPRPGLGVVDRLARAHAGPPRLRSGDAGAGQPPQRGDPAAPVRAQAEPELQGDGPSLRTCCRASTREKTPGQGQS